MQSPFFEDENVSAVLSPTPTTSGETIVRLKAGNALHQLSKTDFTKVLLSTKQVAIIMKAATDVQRIALVTTSEQEIRLIPMHGLSTDWKPILGDDLEYNETYPGYITSKAGPEMSRETLNDIRDTITAGQPPAMNLTYLGGNDVGKDNIFAKIVRGEVPQWRVWESSTHVAFLTPWGNTPGFTVLVPRRHLSSDVLSLPKTDLFDLASAVWEASGKIGKSSIGASRVGLIFEGMEVDYAHAKLIPILERVEVNGQSTHETYRDVYAGYVSSKPGPIAPHQQLHEMNSKFAAASKAISTAISMKTSGIPDTLSLNP